jgi:hypothetical protein
MPRRQPQARWLKRTCPEQTKPVNRVSADDVACGGEAAAWGRRDPKIAAEFVPTDRAPLRGSLGDPRRSPGRLRPSSAAPHQISIARTGEREAQGVAAGTGASPP